MVKLTARCPRCGEQFPCEPPPDGHVACPRCSARLRVAAASPAKAEDLIGQTLGPYAILEVIGRGAMGAVYKAQHQALGRVCAIKVLPKGFARDPSFVERFRREGRAAAAINHPSVIQVFDVGQEKGFSFIVMEYVQGENLGDRVRRDGALAPDAALSLLKQTVTALGAAHALGIVHRDIKPGNILITPGGAVKVADFGLAKRSGVDIDVTAPGSRLGTPMYMSPEVAQGQPADPRSDLYSLGATFYYALTGQYPFDAGSAAAVVAKVLNDEPPPLDTVAPHLPPVLRQVIHRLMAKNPAQRCQTAHELLDALEGRAAQPMPPLPGAAGQPSQAQGRRRKWVVVAVLVGILLVAGIAALILLLRG